MRQIPLGAIGTSALRVQPEHLANRFKDAILPQVLATPVMILIMENASDGNEAIGSGTHQRIVIDLRSFNERLAKKSR